MTTKSEQRLSAIAPALFRPTARTIVRENASVFTSRGSKRARAVHLANGPKGAGLPVMLIPGFLAGDWSMTTLARALKTWDFKPARSGIRLNVDCTVTMVDRLERRLEQLAARSDRSVALVGWSRGGTLGKLLAARRPDLVAGLVTLASPNANPLAVNTMVARQLGLLMKINAAGVKQVMGQECLHGACADSVGEALAAPFPESVPYISVYTRLDGVVDWRACMDPDARLIEVRATHLGIGNDPRILRLVGNQLADLDRGDAAEVPTQRS